MESTTFSQIIHCGIFLNSRLFLMESQKESLDILEDIVSSMEKEITANKVHIDTERLISRSIWKL